MQYNLDYQHSVYMYRCNAQFKLFIAESLLSEPRSNEALIILTIDISGKNAFLIYEYSKTHYKFNLR